MILNCKKALFIISCEEALDFYNYDKEKDILSLEVINKDICYLETEYEPTKSKEYQWCFTKVAILLDRKRRGLIK